MHNFLKYKKKYGELMTKFQFTGTGVQPHRNRKYFKLNNAHDCMYETLTRRYRLCAWPWRRPSAPQASSPGHSAPPRSNRYRNCPRPPPTEHTIVTSSRETRLYVSHKDQALIRRRAFCAASDQSLDPVA